MNRFRRQRLLVLPSTWLGVLALLAQLWLPLAHGQDWARRTGDPLGYAWCGSGGAGLSLRLLEASPPELIERLRPQRATLEKLSLCTLCAGVHAAAAGSPATPAVAATPPRAVASSATAVTVAAARPLLRPQPRGPPRYS